jgi:hypothetical protein
MALLNRVAHERTKRALRGTRRHLRVAAGKARGGSPPAASDLAVLLDRALADLDAVERQLEDLWGAANEVADANRKEGNRRVLAGLALGALAGGTATALWLAS